MLNTAFQEQHDSRKVPLTKNEPTKKEEDDEANTVRHPPPSLCDCPPGMGVAIVFFVILNVWIVYLLVKSGAMA